MENENVEKLQEIEEEKVEIAEIVEQNEEVVKEKKKKKVNLPNILTVVRICLVPVFIILMVLAEMNEGEWAFLRYYALGVFTVASVTDWLDGNIARKKGIVTRFGKLMDPLADKILVAAGFIMLTGLGIVPAWVTAIVVIRDFLLNTIRMFGTEAGETIAAGVTGKIKTVFQMITIVFGLIDTNALFAFIEKGNRMSFDALLLNVGFSVSLVFAVIFTLWSCVDYVIKYRKYIDITE